MSYAEIVVQARQLSFRDRLRLVEELVWSFREQAAPSPAVAADIPPMSALRGALRPEQGPLPTDDEIKDMIVDHLCCRTELGLARL